MNGISFITGKQAFLPFKGRYLTQENEEAVEVTKLMFSAAFGRAFWEYIKKAKYEHKNKSTGNTQTTFNL